MKQLGKNLSIFIYSKAAVLIQGILFFQVNNGLSFFFKLLEEKKKKLATYERKKADIRNTFLTWNCSDIMKTLFWELPKSGHIRKKMGKLLADISLKLRDIFR